MRCFPASEKDNWKVGDIVYHVSEHGLITETKITYAVVMDWNRLEGGDPHYALSLDFDKHINHWGADGCQSVPLYRTREAANEASIINKEAFLVGLKAALDEKRESYRDISYEEEMVYLIVRNMKSDDTKESLISWLDSIKR